MQKNILKSMLNGISSLQDKVTVQLMEKVGATKRCAAHRSLQRSLINKF